MWSQEGLQVCCQIQEPEVHQSLLYFVLKEWINDFFEESGVFYLEEHIDFVRDIFRVGL